MQGKGKTSNTDLPPGFRFHPTDEELIVYYLRNQATSRPCPASIIPEVDIYKFDPWQLPEKAEFGEKEWYFFSPRERKYPNGARPNRATVSGYWKATGTDKAIYSGSKYVGVKKALVFYKGRPPKGVKTVWIMHEYRLNDSRKQVPKKQTGSMRLDDWVLCRIYRKKHVGGGNVEEKILDATSNSNLEISTPSANDPTDQQQQQQMLKFPRTWSLSHIFDLDCIGPITHLLNDNTYYSNPNLDLQSMMCSSGTTDDHDVKFQLGDMAHHYAHPGKLQVNHHVLNKPLFVNPFVYGFQ